MDLFTVFTIALGMSMDAFAVSLSAGTDQRTNSARPIFRLSFHFGLFQAIMPILGWFLGSTIEPLIKNYDHWIAFALLAFVGIRMIRSGFAGDDAPSQADPSRGLTLVMLAIATSIDAFAVGLSLAFLRVSIWTPALVIGIVTSLLSLIGLRLGNQVGKTFGKRVEIWGGLLLIAIGLRIAITHMA